MTKHTPVLIVAQPGRVRDGLQALLMAVPEIEIVGLADDISMALVADVRCDPALVLLDMRLDGGEGRVLLERFRQRWPGARYLLLAENVHQQRAAAAAGVDDSLLKGFSTTRLFESIQRLTAHTVGLS